MLFVLLFYFFVSFFICPGFLPPPYVKQLKHVFSFIFQSLCKPRNAFAYLGTGRPGTGLLNGCLKTVKQLNISLSRVERVRLSGSLSAWVARNCSYFFQSIFDHCMCSGISITPMSILNLIVLCSEGFSFMNTIQMSISTDMILVSFKSMTDFPVAQAKVYALPLFLIPISLLIIKSSSCLYVPYRIMRIWIHC